MTSLKIIAVDDEYWALEGLLAAVRRAVPHAELRGFRDAEEALACAGEWKPDIAFLDIEMRDMSGIRLAELLVEQNSHINIIFTTGYNEYTGKAFELHASGYVMKPVTPERIHRELEVLRYPVEKTENAQKRIHVRAFGSFEVFADGVPIRFRYTKTKELLAYLVDRNGALCNNQEIIAILWEESEQGQHISYLKSIRADLVSTLDKYDCGSILVRRRGGIGIIPDQISCDYYDYLKRRRASSGAATDTREASYRGEYMSQYSWSEVTNSSLKLMQ